MVVRLSKTRAFFGTPKVLRAVRSAERKVLGRFGAFVRTGARHSIRRRRKVSDPGQPPSSHAGLLRRLIVFAWDFRRRSIVIGPLALRSTDGKAPSLLEHGGRDVRRKGGKRVVATYRPRPYMGPSLERERPKLPALWRDSVR